MKILLHNGIELNFIKLPYVHSVSFGLYLKGGCLYENSSNNGITHLLEHLHFRCLDGLNQKELYNKTELLGTTLRGFTYNNFLRFSMLINPKYLNDGTEIMCKILNTKKWNEIDFELEKKVVINQIKEKNYSFNLTQEVKEKLWDNNTFSNRIMGTIESVENLTLSSLIDYNMKIKSKGNVSVYIVGNITSNNIELILDKFNKITLNSYENICNYQISNPKNKVNIIEYDCEFLDVNIIFIVDLKLVSIEKLKIISSILGEGIGSKLQLRIREELCYSSNIFSYVEEYENQALLYIDFSVEQSLLINTVKEIVTILNSLKENILSNELATTLPFYTDNLEFLLDDPSELNFSVAYNEFILVRKYGDVNEKANLYRKITTNDLIIAAKQIFGYDNVYSAFIGNVKCTDEKELKEILKML